MGSLDLFTAFSHPDTWRLLQPWSKGTWLQILLTAASVSSTQCNGTPWNKSCSCRGSRKTENKWWLQRGRYSLPCHTPEAWFFLLDPTCNTKPAVAPHNPINFHQFWLWGEDVLSALLGFSLALVQFFPILLFFPLEAGMFTPSHCTLKCVTYILFLQTFTGKTLSFRRHFDFQNSGHVETLVYLVLQWYLGCQTPFVTNSWSNTRMFENWTYFSHKK